MDPAKLSEFVERWQAVPFPSARAALISEVVAKINDAARIAAENMVFESEPGTFADVLEADEA